MSIKNLIQNKKFFAGLTIIWAVFIFILSNIPGNQYPEAAFDYAFFAHWLEFFILSLLLLHTLLLGRSAISRQIIITSLLICSLYAAFDEIHQIWVPYRSVSLLDWLVDVLGGLSAVKLYLYFYQRFKSKLHTA